MTRAPNHHKAGAIGHAILENAQEWRWDGLYYFDPWATDYYIHSRLHLSFFLIHQRCPLTIP
jgi:hypothetical protein